MVEGRFDDDTQMGLDVMRYGLYFSIFMNVLFGIFFLFWSYDPGDDPSGTACFLSILSIIAGILYLIGIYKLYKGSEKVSFEHEKNVKLAVVLIILGFIFGLASPSMNFGSIEAFRHSMMVGGGLEMIQQICYVLAFLYLVFDIANKKARNFLYVGTALLITISFSRVIWSIYFIPLDAELNDVVLTTLRMLSVITLVMAVGYFLLSMGYKKVATATPEKKSEEESQGVPFKKECPNCGSEKFTKYLDGSGYCEFCGMISGDEEDPIEKQDVE